MTNSLQVADKKVVLVLSDQNKNVYLSARNLERVKVVTASEINAYTILNCTSLIMAESSIAVIDKLLKA